MKLRGVESLNAICSARSGFDSLILICGDATLNFQSGEFAPLHAVVQNALKVDARIGKETSVLVAPEDVCPAGRLIVAPTGPLTRDYDDARRIADAAKDAAFKAKAAGSRRPAVVVAGIPNSGGIAEYPNALEVALLGVLQALYEAPEDRGNAEPAITEIGFTVVPKVDDASALEHIARIVTAIEHGRIVARDIESPNCEVMTPLNVAAYVRSVFAGTKVKVEVVDSLPTLSAEYPCLMAVARASLAVPRHHPCVIRLEYDGEGPIERSLFVVGKGITYDSGGIDVKTNGHMAGMSRDKGGAAAAAGIVMAACQLAPKHVRVVAELAMARNSVGPDSYVADEIITSHSGMRVRVVNTDAEGRMVLTDCLSHLRERAVTSPSPVLLTIATLTGHVGRALGPYTALVENGPARDCHVSDTIQTAGDQWAEMCEISRLRREDYNFVQPKNASYDVLQSGTASSVETSRGHQFPAAFLVQASGLARHGRDSAHPLPYCHMDIAAAALENYDWMHGKPTAAPVVATSAAFFLPHL